MRIATRLMILCLLLLFVLPLGAHWLKFGLPKASQPDGSTRIAVSFSEGHDTKPVDHGRPVILIAGALGVRPEVFREAFSHVNPAPGGTRPTREREQKNKHELMTRLEPYGITNDRLDTVSNYYRYRPQSGRLWPTDKAKAYATEKDGVITGFEIINGGSGYSSLPTVTVPGHEGTYFSVELHYGADFKRNGSIKAINSLGVLNH